MCFARGPFRGGSKAPLPSSRAPKRPFRTPGVIARRRRDANVGGLRNHGNARPTRSLAGWTRGARALSPLSFGDLIRD